MCKFVSLFKVSPTAGDLEGATWVFMGVFQRNIFEISYSQPTTHKSLQCTKINPDFKIVRLKKPRQPVYFAVICFEKIAHRLVENIFLHSRSGVP